MNTSRRALNIGLDFLIHLIITLEIALIVYLRVEDIFYIFPAVLGGIFVDTDHILNYFFSFKKFDFKGLMVSPYQKPKRVYLIFHSWELVVVGGFFAFFFHSLFWQIFIFSLALHLLVDNLDGVKRKGFFHYFFLYRLSRRFRIEELRGFVFD